MLSEGIEVLAPDRNVVITSFLDYIRNHPYFPHVRFIVLYGSVAARQDDPSSDIDITISCDLPDIDSERFRIFLLGRVPGVIDLHIFEHLPLYVQIEVLKGMLLYTRDIDEVYDAAERTIRDYEFFRPHLLDYIGVRAL